MKKLSISLLLWVVGTTALWAQTEDPFVGTFSNFDGSVMLQIKAVDGGYQGLVQTAGGLFALDAERSDGRIEGRVYSGTEAIAFEAGAGTAGLTVTAMGETDRLSRISSTHQLDQIDLTPYLTTTPAAPAGDYDYGYSQADPGLASEELRVPPPGAPAQAGGDTYDDPELLGLIAGSQLVYYQRTSYLNDSSASSLTYVNFCPDRRFSITYEGSFSVEGDYYGNAQGASHGRQSGTWRLIRSQGMPALQMAFRDGRVDVYPVDREKARAGRWRVGNTQYAVQRGGAVCR